MTDCTNNTEVKNEAAETVENVTEEVTTEETAVNLEEKVAELEKNNLYLKAEMQNLHKRQERELETIKKTGSKKVILSFVKVLDDVERSMTAINNTEEKTDEILKGLEMVQSSFMKVLKSHGVEEVNAEGEVFDPNVHEAMTTQEDKSKEDNTVLQVFEKGYSLNGVLIRPAKVIINKHN